MKNFDNYGLDMLQAVIALALSFLMIGAWAIAGLPLLYVSLPILGYSFWKMYKVFQKWRFWKSANHSVVVHVPYSRLADNAKAGNTLIGYGGQWSIDSARLAFLAKGQKMPEDKRGKPYIHAITGNSGEVLVPTDSFSMHCAVIGTTGSGKSTCFTMLNVQQILSGHSSITIDPKGDPAAIAAAKQAAKDAGCPFYYFNPSDEENSVCLDLLGTTVEPAKLATLITAQLFEESSEKVFAKFAWEAVFGLCSGLILLGEKPTISRLSEIFTESNLNAFVTEVCRRTLQNRLSSFNYEKILDEGGGLKGVKQRDFFIAKVREKCPGGIDGFDSLISYVRRDNEFAEKITASLRPLLALLSSGTLRGLLSPVIGNSKKVVYFNETLQHQAVFYICLDSLSDKQVGRAVGQLVLGNVALLAGLKQSSRDKQEKESKIAVFVDEASELAGETLVTLLNKGRSAGLMMFLATQTYSDFVAGAGNRDIANSLFGNIGTVFVLRCNDAITKDYFGESFGRVCINVSQDSNTVQTSVEGDRRYGQSKQMKQIEVPFFDGNLIADLPDLESVVKTGSDLQKVKIPIIDWEK